MIVVIPPPCYNKSDEVFSCETLNEEMPALIKDLAKGCRIVDLHREMGSDIMDNSGLFFHDGIHPNDKGYQVIASEIMKQLK